MGYIGLCWGIDLVNPGDPSIQTIPTLDPRVYKSYLHWTIWIPRVRVCCLCTT